MMALEVVGLQKDFGGLRALTLEHFSVEQGERRAILGPNGAGKTTFFNLVSGSIQPARGTVRFFGSDVTRLSVHQRAKLGISRTFQIINVFPGLTVAENALIALQAADGARLTPYRVVASFPHLMKRADRLLEQWDLAETKHQRVRDLSYGSQRKVELMLTLAKKPRLLLLDEPTAGLSASEMPMVISIIQQMDPEITILLIEHDMDVAFQLSQKVTILFQGSVLLEGEPEAIKKDPRVAEIYFGTDSDNAPA